MRKETPVSEGSRKIRRNQMKPTSSQFNRSIRKKVVFVNKSKFFIVLFQMIIEKMAQNANSSVVQENFSWMDQFKEALTLREGKFREI